MKVYSTVEVGRRCAAACGKHVGDAFVRDSYLAMYALPPMGPGRALQITEDQARIIVAYAMEWHGSSKAPGIVPWTGQRGYEIPKIRKSTMPSVVKRPLEASAVDVSNRIALVEKAVASLAKDLEKIVSGRFSRRHRAPPEQITGGTEAPVDPRRERIVKLVKSWVREHIDVIDYASAWAEIYHAFWEQLGRQPPLEWYTSQLRNDTKLDFFEKHDWMGVLHDSLPGIIGTLDAKYVARDPQKDLFK